MTYQSAKLKQWILIGGGQYLETFGLLFFDADIARRVYAQADAIPEDMPGSIPDALYIICSSQPDAYAAALERRGAKRGRDYEYAADILWEYLKWYAYGKYGCFDEYLRKVSETRLEIFKKAASEPPVCRKRCTMPGNSIYIMYEGIKGCCISPVTVGFPEYDSYTDIINGFDYRLFRAGMLNGTYIFCKGCDFLKAADTNRVFTDGLDFDRALEIMRTKPSDLRLGFDPSCNLACKSCRRSRFMYHTAPEDEKTHFKNVYKHILENWIEHADRLNLGINGDSFASPFYRDIAMNHFTGSELTIQTNGLLLRPSVLRQLTDRYYGRTELKFFISIDAASDKTYKILRGGNFTALCENLRFLGEERKQGRVGCIQLNFLIQKENYREAADFVRLGKSVNADIIYFQRLYDRIYTPEVYDELNVLRPAHPEYGACREILKDPVFGGPAVRFEDQFLD